jgi:hypothetical protein
LELDYNLQQHFLIDEKTETVEGTLNPEQFVGSE